MSASMDESIADVLDQGFETPVIEFRDLKSLVPYARNARKHSDQQVVGIAAMIAGYGWTNAILIDESDGIVAGHGRVLGADLLYAEGKSLRFADGTPIPHGKVPTVTCRGWSEAQKRAYIIADNQWALNAEWDSELLAFELDELRDFGIDATTLGFSAGDIAELIGTPNTGPPDDRDADAQPAIGPAITRLGDVWKLGNHSVMCGDARNPEHVSMLIGNSCINVAFTSPPYAEQREYDQESGFKPIRPAEYVRWFEPVARNVSAVLAPDGSWFVNIKPSAEGLDTSLYVFDLVIAHVRQWGWHFATEFCWERPGVPKNVTRRFKNQFEPVYQFARGTWKMRPDAVRHPSDNVPRPGGPGVGNTSWAGQQGVQGASLFGAAKKRKGGTTEWLADRQGTNSAPGEYIGPGLAYPGNRLPTFSGSHEALGHAAAFPVGLPEFFLRAYSDDGDAAYDPFVGTGSTIIACEKNDRVGFGMELSPAYVDITVRRWQQYTNAKAVRVSDGVAFDAA